MKVSNRLVLLLAICSSTLFAQQNIENYLSKNKQIQFTYDYEKNDAQFSLLRDSWISPLMLSYSYTKSDPLGDEQTNQVGALQLNQPIFQSGGIYFGIKYAKALKQYSDFMVDMAKKQTLKEALSLLLQIKKVDYNIKRQKLQIANAQIDLEQKKEQYLHGQLASGVLDQAIIEQNRLIQQLYNTQTSKEKLITNFKTLSDVSYEKIPIPSLKLVSKEEFLSHNLALKIAYADIKKNNYNKYTTVAKYLPRINLVAGYNWTKTKIPVNGKTQTSESNYYNYGINISLPININTFVDIEQSHLAYLKAKAKAQEEKIKAKALFEEVMQNLANIQKKKELSQRNIELYLGLLKDTKELKKSGYKTQYDVELMQNSVDISKLDIQIYEIEKQLELLTLYGVYLDEI